MSRRYVYVLRSDRPSGKSYGGFRWPGSGPVEAPDWNDRAECGGGLHGLLWGCGYAGMLSDPSSSETRWRVVKVAAADVIDLGGKVKFPRGEVVYFGDRDGALALLDRRGASDKPVVYAARTAGDYGTATAGYYGTATAGDYGIIQIKRWNVSRYRIVTGYIGEDGLLPNVAYRLDDAGRFVRKDGAA